MEKYKHYHMSEINPARLTQELGELADMPEFRFEIRGFEPVGQNLSEPKQRNLTHSHGKPTASGVALAGEYVVHTEEPLTVAQKQAISDVLRNHDPVNLSRAQSNAEQAQEYTDYIETWIDDSTRKEEVNYRAAWLVAWRNGGFAQ